MSKPPDIIGHSHAHTVCLPEGSNVAARKAARKPEAGAELPPPKARAAARPVPAAAKPARAGTAAAKPAAARRASTSPGLSSTGLADEPLPLNEAILRRIAQLQESNEAVRAEFERLAATRSAAADSWSLL